MVFTINSDQVLWVCTSLAALWTAWGIFKQIKKPSDDHRAMLLKHDNDLKEHDELFAKDNRRLITLEDGYRKMLEWQTEQHRINMENERRFKEDEESRKVIMKSLYVIINHTITGNGIDQLKNVRDDLNNFLIEK